MPNTITYHFKETHDSFLPLKGKPSDNDLLAIRETVLPLLMVIPYDQLNGVYSLVAILTKTVVAIGYSWLDGLLRNPWSGVQKPLRC